MPAFSTLARLAVVAGGLLAEVVAPAGCAACGEPVRPAVLLCLACAATIERAQPDAQAPRAAFEYGGAIATAIVRFKYEDRPDLGERLGRALLGSVPADRPFDVVLPVPLHPVRLAARGYNQSALLATPIARALGVPLASRALVRVRNTPKQALGLRREERAANVEGAFRVARAAGLAATPRVLLVDDVATTGSTLAACTAALREGGAQAVTALVLARRR